jgi:hypothetical protein
MTPILPKGIWSERFTMQLLILCPQLSAVQAAHVAMEEFEEACDFDPETAAAMYADDSTDI